MMKEALLYRNVLLKEHDQPLVQFVPPSPFRCETVLGCHDDFSHRFFWPKMAADVSEHIRTCERYIHFKIPQERAVMTITASYPLELVHLDFLTIRTKNDSNKNVNVLVITDHFTRYAAVYITPKQTAPIVAKVLWENF